MSQCSARGSTGWARWRKHPPPPPADETRRQSSEIQVAARRSTFLVYVGARRRLSEILAAFAFQVRRLGLSDGVSGGGGSAKGKIKLAKHLPVLVDLASS